ncbi:MAG: helix-turn-helix domain-containing protein [Draconibacterium sp.]
MSESFIDKVRHIIQQRLQDENFGVSDLASELGLSRSQALRKIKAATGKSVNQFIRDVRLEEARKLLGNQNLTASEIAYKIGFSSPSYFNKCFLDQYEITPGEYKKQLENGTVAETISGSTGRIKKQTLLFLGFIFLVIVFAAIYAHIEKKDKRTANLTSIAVLPLLDFSESHDKDYLADGITEAITLELARNESIRVISRGSAMKYKNEKKLYSEIADELGVDLLLEGSVLSGNDTLRVVVQLIKPKPEERHIWQNSYDRKHSDILGLIHNVSNEIASEISDVVEPATARSKPKPVNPKAYDFYLQGRHLLNNQTMQYESLQKAIEYVSKAIGVDPKFTESYVTLAQIYLAINSVIGDNEEKLIYREKARKAVEKALQLDPFSPEALITKGNLAGRFDWDWETMKGLAEKALQIEPSNLNAYIALSDYYIVKGNYEKAIELASQAVVLDPVNAITGHILGRRLYVAGKYDQAIEQFEKVIELNPTYGWAFDGIGFAYFQKGDFQNSVKWFQKLQYDVLGNVALGDCYKNRPFEECLQFYIDNARNKTPRFCSNPLIIAQVFMMLDDKQGALEFLTIAYRFKNGDLPVMIAFPDFKPLHENSEFQQIANDIGVVLPD